MHQLSISIPAAVLGLTLICGLASAADDDAIHAPASKTIGQKSGPAKAQVEPSLIVMNSRGASLDGTTLTLTGVSPDSIIFADRPVRAAGHALTADLVGEWTKSAGKDGFGVDPPNATVSVLGSDGGSVSDAVVVLKSPKLDGDKLTFDVQVLEGKLANADGPASVFIDIIGLPFTPLSFAGVARRSAYRGAYYAGAAAGAAAAAYPYYRPAYPPPPEYYPYYRPY
jgi:hypothetical protein